MNILITGGTGSLGQELTKQLLGKYNIRIYSRGEQKQVEMSRKFKNIEFVIGDIRDKKALNMALKGIDYVYHLAALKHIPICEDNPWEAVMTNIIGTQNVIEYSIQNKVKKVLAMSTDKAVNPRSQYGLTKACAEKLIIKASKTNTKLSCVRSGNILNTAGSVIPLFKKQIKQNNEITITDLEMTRLVITKEDIANSLIDIMNKMEGDEIFIIKMPRVKLDTIADAVIQLYGDKYTKKKIIGIRAGEKKHEVLMTKEEIKQARAIDSKYLAIVNNERDIPKELDIKSFKEMLCK